MINTETLKLYIAANKELSKEKEETLSLSTSEFLNRLKKQKKVKTNKGSCIFASKVYKPHLTSVEQSVFVYMFENNILNKKIHLKRRMKKTYMLEKIGDIYTFFINDRYTKNKALYYFIVEKEVANV